MSAKSEAEERVTLAVERCARAASAADRADQAAAEAYAAYKRACAAQIEAHHERTLAGQELSQARRAQCEACRQERGEE